MLFSRHRTEPRGPYRWSRSVLSGLLLVALVVGPSALSAARVGFYMESGYTELNLVGEPDLPDKIAGPPWRSRGIVLDTGVFWGFWWFRLDTGIHTPFFFQHVPKLNENYSLVDNSAAASRAYKSFFKGFRDRSQSFWWLDDQIHFLWRPYAGFSGELSHEDFPLGLIYGIRNYYMEWDRKLVLGHWSAQLGLILIGRVNTDIRVVYDLPLRRLLANRLDAVSGYRVEDYWQIRGSVVFN